MSTSRRSRSIPNGSSPQPPKADRIEHVRLVHGAEIRDPYHWLRDPGYPEVTDKRILDYLREENEYYRRILEPQEGRIDRIVAELRARIEEEDSSVPVRDGDFYYQSRFGAGDEYRTHHRRHADSDSWQLIVDERALAGGHDSFTLGGLDVSDDGLVAYATDTEGDERFRIFFRDIDSGNVHTESIANTIGEPIWLPGTRTLLYLELSEAWRPYRVRAHVFGTPVQVDSILYEESDDGFFVDVDLSQDRKYIIVTASDHETSEVRVRRVDSPLDGPFRLVAPRRRGHEYQVDHGGDKFFVLTNDRSLNFRIVQAADDHPQESGWEELVSGRVDVYIRGFTPFASFLLVEERADATDRIVIVSRDGVSTPIDFPEALYSAHEGENPEFDVSTVQLRYESMITPPTVYDYDVRSGSLRTRKVARIPSGYDPRRYRTERIEAPARDGRSVPVSIVYRDDFPTDGSGCIHLYAYGAYGVGTPPGFSRNQLTLLDRGFAFAIAHVRGGDDLGYGWYLDGKLLHRRNTFNDFVDAARCLIDTGYTSAGRICITGGSAGGEIVGVALNEAPELWAAAVAHVPFVDVTNTMLDESLPLTPMEWPEWGNPVDDREAFEYIRSYSPYDNVRPQRYPPLLVTAGLNDPRVTYWEPAKWTALLRHEKTDANVLLLKTNMGAGHAGRSGRFEHLRETAEEMVFLLLSTPGASQ